MNDKFSQDVQAEIHGILINLKKWDNYFDINIDFYFDGWAIFLKEKNAFPRRITIFKSYCNNTYSIKSFEVHLRNLDKEEFKELYFINDISNKEILLEELNAVIYGKDLAKNASEIYHKSVLNNH